ncbi:MAG: IS66 family transposase [Pseudomonadota bacterium]
MKVKKIEISGEEAEALLERVKSSLTEEDYQIIKGLVDTHLLLGQAVTEKKSSISRLLKMIFGDKTEKTRNIRKDLQDKTIGRKKNAKGHGKKSADDYVGAETVKIDHTTLQHCNPCPLCQDGKLYKQTAPGVIVRIKGTAPLQATVYQLEKLRCNICGKIFTADLPIEAGLLKYDETASAMLAILRYNSGVALNRISKLQNVTGIPLAASTGWDVIEKMADKIHPVFPELIRQAAQGDVVYYDDTNMKVQDLVAENKDKTRTPTRTGIFTTGILSILDDRKIALFFTGRNHAGENMAKVLAERQDGLDPPIQMCYALSRNSSEEFKAILANCLVHGRRNFVEIADNFQDECLHVLKTFGKVYHIEAITKEQGMTPAQRLQHHQVNSRPLLDELHAWMGKQIEEKKVEPNSGLGRAIKYMNKHWQPLTLFLRVEKAPLDNNICEQTLKMAILHRKNSLFFKTEHGAYIGDMFMSIIHTCALAKFNPFEYLVALQKNFSALFANPSR